VDWRPEDLPTEQEEEDEEEEAVTPEAVWAWDCAPILSEAEQQPKQHQYPKQQRYGHWSYLLSERRAIFG
jgi:hypothetical protein